MQENSLPAEEHGSLFFLSKTDEKIVFGSIARLMLALRA
jgi:hypothetical protein